MHIISIYRVKMKALYSICLKNLLRKLKKNRLKEENKVLWTVNINCVIQILICSLKFKRLNILWIFN